MQFATVRMRHKKSPQKFANIFRPGFQAGSKRSREEARTMEKKERDRDRDRDRGRGRDRDRDRYF